MLLFPLSLHLQFKKQSKKLPLLKVLILMLIIHFLRNKEGSHIREQQNELHFLIQSLQYLFLITLKSDHMQEQQPGQGVQQYQTKILKVQKKGNELKVLGTTKSRLMVQNNSVTPSDEEIFEELEASNERITRPKSKNMTKNNEDFVDLPKINFLSEQSGIKSKKSLDGLNNQAHHQDQQVNTRLKSQIEVQISQDSESISNQNAQWGGWNINNINIIPSKNNYVQGENYDYLDIPSNKNIKSTSLAVSQQTNRSRERSREKKRSEKDRYEERKLFKERQRRERERNIEIVTEFLSGKASVIWLFILNTSIKEENLREIKDLYKNHMENDYEVPICRSYEEATKFLKIQSCFFKIVADIQSSQKLIQESHGHKNVIAIYIYNPKGEVGINRSFELKKATKKIKGMFLDLSDAAKQATEQIQNQPKFIKVDDELEQERTKLRFPSFIQLTGYDNTEVTAYRLCLYGSLKLKDKKERMEYLKEFTDMVELRYAEVPKELKNLQDYKKIDHMQDSNQTKSRQILNFYVRQSFYYVLINSILRLSRSSQEFRPCTIPFNETYHAIKHYYQRYRQQTNKKTKKFVTYRGSKLRNNDAKALQIGSYIELLGFTSTSLKRAQAEKFMDNDSYLFEIIVENCSQNDQELFYDHGFVEINRYGLANEAFKNEQEVLFNALNVFKVVNLDLTSAVRKITLRYGAIFDLLRSKPEDLSPHQRAVIANYQYCTKTYNAIEDDGDVLLLAQEHDRCVDYYQAKIDEGQINYKVYGKIANAQYENGDLEEAYNNALRSLEELNKQPLKNQKEVSRNYSKYQKNKDIFDMKQDHIHFKSTIEKYVRILGEDWFKQAKLFKQRGQKCLKAGDLQTCNNDLMKSKEILKQRQQSFQKRRKEINRRYMLRSFCCMCSRSATRQLEEQKQLELIKIQEDEIDFENRKDEVHQLYFQIQTLLKQLAEKIGNKQLENESQRAASLHFNSMSKTNNTQSPIIVAKYLVMEASLIEDKQNTHQKYEQLMQDAIAEVKKQDPFHQQLGVYQNILGAQRHATIKRRMLLEPIHNDSAEHQGSVSNQEIAQVNNNYLNLRNEENTLSLPNEASPKYNYESQNNLYKKSKESYCDAAENIAYNKGVQNPDYLSIRNSITELDLDFSRLKQSQKTAQQSKDIKLSNNHSQGAKCYLLIAKICLAKGQLKRSFRNIEKAYEVLKNALVKMDTKEYNNIFMHHPYYMEISIQKVKIFNRQMRHDLALKQLQISKKIAKIKVEKMHSKVILATVYQEQAAILICMGETIAFEEYLNKAINIRSQEIGKFNIPNAICYSNLFKYLRVLNDSEDALAYHHKAIEIFSRFPSDHPNAWIIHLSNGLYFFQKKEIDKFIAEMEYCIRVASKRYSANHINILKIMFQFGKMLMSVEENDKALSILRRLEIDLEESLKQSLRGQKLEKEIDDEKIPLRRNLYCELKEIYSKVNKDPEISMQDELKRVQKKLKDYEHLLTSDRLMKSSTQIK